MSTESAVYGQRSGQEPLPWLVRSEPGSKAGEKAPERKYADNETDYARNRKITSSVPPCSQTGHFSLFCNAGGSDCSGGTNWNSGDPWANYYQPDRNNIGPPPPSYSYGGGGGASADWYAGATNYLEGRALSNLNSQNPVNYIDPEGLSGKSWVETIMGRNFTEDELGKYGSSAQSVGHFASGLTLNTAIGLGTSVLGLVNNYQKLPTTPKAAGMWGLDLIVNKTSLISGLLPSSNSKAYADLALGVAGTGIAIFGSSPTMAVLAGYGLGNAINGFPVGNSNVQNVLSDTIWKWSHR